MRQNAVSTEGEHRYPGPPALEYLTSILMVAGATLVCEILHPFLLPLNMLMIYLVTVVLAALNVGLKPAIVTVALSGFMHNYLYVPPRFGFDFQHKEYLATFFGLLVAGTVISSLVTKARERAEALRIREAETASLYRLSRELVTATDSEGILATVTTNIEKTLTASAALFITHGGQLELSRTSSGFAPNSDECKTAEQAAVNGKYAEHHQPFRGKFCCFPLATMNRTFGVMAVALSGDSIRSPEQTQRLLEAFATQTALALERVELSHEAEQAQNLRARQKLERALLNSVSHDLRTPLSTITGVLSSILVEGDRLVPAVQRELLENAKDEADRLNRFVGKLLDMTRLEAGGVILKMEPCDVQDLIGCALGAMERQLLNRPVMVNLAPDLPLVAMDMALMNQVLINIIDNATKYSPAESSIELQAWCTDGHLTITVADRGPGIPHHELERVFEKFYRVPIPEGVSGTGLGLSICHGIVEAHGGTVRAENRATGGLAITISIPLSPAAHSKDTNHVT